MSIFSDLNLWIDETDRTVAGQMAMDEAILQSSRSERAAFLRFYILPENSITLGFFMPVSEVDPDRRNKAESIVRRLTGGGIVYHGQDITFSLVVGKHHPLSSEPTVERYRVLHVALCDALIRSGIWIGAELLPVSSASTQKPMGCFENPVGWDVMDQHSGAKIGGGAQRRSGGAWLHQGTVQVPGERSIGAPWINGYAGNLGDPVPWSGGAEIEELALELESTRYSSSEWNNRVT